MATAFTYEPGSTFKAFTVAGALQQHLVTPSTLFYLPIELQVADRRSPTRSPAAPRAHRRPDPRAVVQRRRGRRLGSSSAPSTSTTGCGASGSASPTGIQFPGEEQGIVPRRRRRVLSGSTMGNLPIGQGLSVTPMQMAAAYSAIADGGILRQPQLVLDRATRPSPSRPGHRVISPPDRRASCGRCWRASSRRAAPRPRSASRATRWPARREPPRWPMTAATRRPSSSPRSSASPRHRNPSFWSRSSSTSRQGSYYGGTVAAPAFGEIAKFALPYLEIPPDTAAAH